MADPITDEALLSELNAPEGAVPADIEAELNALAANDAPVDQAASYSAGRKAEAEERKAGAVGLLKEGAGILLGAEPVRRVYEGGKQKVLAVLESQGKVPPGTTKDYTEEFTLRRLDKTGNEGLDEQMADVGEGLLLAIPGISMTRAFLGAKVSGAFKVTEPVTYIRGIAQTMKQAAIGGAIGSGAMEATQAPGDEEYDAAAAVLAEARFNAIMSSGVAGVGASLLMAPTGFTNMLARLAKDADQNETTLQLLKNGVLSKYEYFLSQRTGNTRVRNLEIQIAATKAQNAFNEQFGKFASWTDNLLTAWKRGMGQTASVDDTALALRIQRGWRTELENTRKAANQVYGTRMSRAIALAGQDNAKYPIPFGQTQAVAQKWQAEASNEPWWRKLHPGAKGLNPEMKALDDYLQSITAMNNAPLPNGVQRQLGSSMQGMSIQEVMRMRAALNRADKPYYDAKHSPNGPTTEQNDLHRAVTELKSAIDADVDAYMAANQGRNLPAMAAIEEYRAANAAYKQDQQVIDGLEQTSVNQMFGYRIDKNPSVAIMDLAGRSPGQQQIVVDALRKHDPEGLEAMQAFLLQEANKNIVRNTGPAVSGMYDPEAWGKTLLTEENRRIAERIFTPAQYAQIGRGLDTIRILNNGIQTNGQLITSIGSTPELQGVVMALASLNNAFLARAATRAVGLGPIERVLFTKEGQELLDTIRPIAQQIQLKKVKVMPRDASRAIGRIAAIMTTQEVTPEEQE